MVAALPLPSGDGEISSVVRSHIIVMKSNLQSNCIFSAKDKNLGYEDYWKGSRSELPLKKIL